MFEFETIMLSAGIVAVAGVILGLLIGMAAKRFEVKTDPRIEAVRAALPGANCGGCGYAGCDDFAKALVLKNEDPTKCPVSDDEQRKAVEAALGRTVELCERFVAVVFCSGSFSHSGRSAEYNGVLDCRSAAITGNGGGKACRFGCLGFGSCAKICPFNAIEMRDGLAIVHPEICKGCGKCVSICPRKLIRLVPASVKVHVYCNSLDRPQLKRRLCSMPCLSCRKCVKAAPKQMQAQNQLVRVNYNNPPDETIIVKAACPTGALQREICHRQQTSCDICCEHGKGKK